LLVDFESKYLTEEFPLDQTIGRTSAQAQPVEQLPFHCRALRCTGEPVRTGGRDAHGLQRAVVILTSAPDSQRSGI
jgi:hypothetical protein